MQIIAQNTVTMSSLEMAELTGKRHDNVKRTIDTLSTDQYEDSGDLKRPAVIARPQIEDGIKSANGVVIQAYRVNKRDSFVVVAQLCPEFTARLVDRWQELESANYGKTVALPHDYISALEQLLESKKLEQAAIEQRDHAIATKAQIGSKREATAMSTASKAVREANKLRDQLGFTSRHATILHVEDATGQSFSFVGLRKWCKANGIFAEVVPDKRFPKGVKAWPAGAWFEVYGIDLADLFGEVAA